MYRTLADPDVQRTLDRVHWGDQPSDLAFWIDDSRATYHALRAIVAVSRRTGTDTRDPQQWADFHARVTAPCDAADHALRRSLATAILRAEWGSV